MFCHYIGAFEHPFSRVSGAPKAVQRAAQAAEVFGTDGLGRFDLDAHHGTGRANRLVIEVQFARTS
jgi:hypothetical protein